MSANIRIDSPLIVVSNRLPFILQRDPETGKLSRKQSAGGLVTAVAPVVVKCKGIWIGWPGIHLSDFSEEIPENSPDSQAPTSGLLSSQTIPLITDPKVFDDYYNGCCNGTFWPLFHSMPDRATFEAAKWESYIYINNIFTKLTVKAVTEKLQHSKEPPLIWIHDYHLMTMGSNVRQALEEKQIGCKYSFFLHIPFPPWDIFRLFPWGDEILQGILGADMVGFHIEDYCLNFIDCCQRLLGLRVDRHNMLVEIADRTVLVRALPIGIPFDRFVKLSHEAPKVVSSKNEKIILGVDRLDYTKGLAQRFRAIERFLERYPDYLENVILLQIVVPSRTDVREYAALKEEIDQIVGHINGRFSTPNWSPIRYICGCVCQEQLAAYYRDASVALVTPLRDGMNLVAKEFVACQTENPGVLILSPFAGSGETMHEALLVNPYEIDSVADTIHEALSMPEDERELRITYLRRRERINDVNAWLRSFFVIMGLADANSNTRIVSEQKILRNTHMMPLTPDDFNASLHQYLDEEFIKLVLLLDYDGTLAPIAPRPELAIFPEETKKTLERLSHVNDIHIAIVSGRGMDDLRQMVGIEGITYAANHGLEIMHPDGTKFCHPIPADWESKVTSLLKDLQEECCHDGAWVENKGIILTYHYREAPYDIQRALVDRAKELIFLNGFKAIDAHRAVEARPLVNWNKGRASLYILRTMLGVDWMDRGRVIYVGDDVTDEDAIRALRGVALTFRVANSAIVRTTAKQRLPNTDAVLSLLKSIEKYFLNRPGNRRRSQSGISCPSKNSVGVMAAASVSTPQQQVTH